MKNSTLEQTEKEVPRLARLATRAAYRRALRAGEVVVYRNGDIVRLDSEGKRVVLKTLEPRIRINKGKRFELQNIP